MISKQGIQLLKCPQCGGETEAVASTCDYCGSALTDNTANAEKPDQIAPLAITRESAEKIITAWLKKNHEDVPLDFAKSFKLLSLEADFWPFYYFTGVYSGWRRESTISGGVNELISVSKELSLRKCGGQHVEFFEPPKKDVTIEELSRRAMNDLFEEMRAQAHLEFCRQVLESSVSSPLKNFDSTLIETAELKPFSQSFDAAQNQLKKVLQERVKIRDVYFTQLSSKRIYWPFWTAEYRYKTTNYFLMLDGAGDGSYIGGFKPVNPEKSRLDINHFLDEEPEVILKRYNMSSESITDINGDRTSEFRDFAKKLYPAEKQDKEVGVDLRCFIATAAYGSEWTSELDILRKFRDKVLLKTLWGNIFVKFYYHLSPTLAKQIEQNQSAKKWTRKLLTPIVLRCKRYLEI